MTIIVDEMNLNHKNHSMNFDFLWLCRNINSGSSSCPIKTPAWCECELCWDNTLVYESGAFFFAFSLLCIRLDPIQDECMLVEPNWPKILVPFPFFTMQPESNKSHQVYSFLIWILFKFCIQLFLPFFPPQKKRLHDISLL